MLCAPGSPWSSRRLSYIERTRVASAAPWSSYRTAWHCCCLSPPLQPPSLASGVSRHPSQASRRVGQRSCRTGERRDPRMVNSGKSFSFCFSGGEKKNLFFCQLFFPLFQWIFLFLLTSSPHPKLLTASPPQKNHIYIYIYIYIYTNFFLIYIYIYIYIYIFTCMSEERGKKKQKRQHVRSDYDQLGVRSACVRVRARRAR